MTAVLTRWPRFRLSGAALLSLTMLAPVALAGEPKPDDGRAAKALEEEAAKEKRLRDEIRAQAGSHLEAARQLFSTFEYEAARKELELTLQLDGTNEDARRLLTRVNDILGQRRDRIKSAVAQLYGEHKVAIQEKLIELDNKIDWARRFISEAQTTPGLDPVQRIRKMQQALESLERARELIKWMPFEIKTDEQSNEVSRLITETTRAIKTAQLNLEKANQETARLLAQERQAAAKKAEERKISMMLDHARSLYETGRYGEAVTLAEKILESDPTNTEANTIIAVSRDKYHIKRQDWIEEEYQNQFKLNRERADRMNIPHSEYLIYPSNWREIAQRSSTDFKRKAEEPWKQEIRRKLARRVSFEFQDTPLEDAINFLQSLTKQNIIIDPKVAAESGKTPITLRVSEMELEQALKWILRLAELEFDLRNQAVFITKKTELLANVELEIYDIRDLTTGVADFPGPRIDIGTANAGAAIDPFAQPAQGATLQAADLSTLIKDKLLTAEFADPATSIEESGGKLVVMQRPEIHDRIRMLLRSFRETQTIQVLTHVRFIDVTENFLETIGVHFTGLDSAPSERGFANAAIDPLRQPSRYGLFPAGGGPGLNPPIPSDIQPSPAFQFADFIPRRPFKQDFGGNAALPDPRPIQIIRPRLDPNFPVFGNGAVGPANAPAGFRRQWFEKAFGSPVLIQALTQNLARINPLTSALGQNVLTSPQQGALFQFRFLQSTQSSAILQALRKDQTADQLLAPKLMQYNNQRSHIMVAQQRSYIKDYDVSGTAYDPVIGSFLTGVVLEVKPTVSNDKKYITLDVRPGTAIELTAPIIVYITNSQNVATGGGTLNYPIELPNLELRSISTTVTVPDNGTMLFSGLINDRKIDAKIGIPLLSDLPLVGRFFSTNNKERVRRNLLVLINSRVVLFDEEEARL